ISISLYTCMESPLIISPEKVLATSILNFVFPTAVGPTMAITLYVICIPLVFLILSVFIHTLDMLLTSTYIFLTYLGCQSINLVSAHQQRFPQVVYFPRQFPYRFARNRYEVVL